jgi:hypothetical protein
MISLLFEAPRERSSRIRKPTQAVIEAKETEVIYGRKSRTQRRREEREAVKAKDSSPRQDAELRKITAIANLAIAMELYLGDHNAFRAREEVKERIPTPKTYEEAVSDPTYGAKWKEAIQLELRTLIQFWTWRYVRRPKDQAVVLTRWVFDIKYGADGRID